jgi:hypothetical protein
MVWEVKAGRAGAARWAKWVDLDAASRHLEALQSLLNRTDNAQLMSSQAAAEALASEVGDPNLDLDPTRRGSSTSGMNAEQWASWKADRLRRQTERVRQLAESVRGFCLAVDVDPLNLGSYASARLNAFNRGDLAVFDSEQTWQTGLSAAIATNPEAAARITANPYFPEIFSRVDFTTGAAVIVRDAPQDPDEGVDATISVMIGPGSWNAWEGWIVKYWTIPTGAAALENQVTALLPLRAAWEFWSGVARVLLRLKINGALARTSAYVILRNTQLSRALGGTGLPDTIINSSAALDVAHLSGDAPLSPTQEALVGSVIALVAAINPVAGAIAGVVWAVAELVARLLPPAVAVPVDEWGRRGFFLLAQDYTGKLAPKAAPTHAIPPAIGPVVVPTPNPWTEGVLGEEPARIVAETTTDSGSGNGILIAGGLALLAKLLAG